MTEPSRPAVVTGASGGFGRAIATALAADSTVVGLAREGHRLQTLYDELGDRFVPVVGDAVDEELATRLLEERSPGLLVLKRDAVVGFLGSRVLRRAGVWWMVPTRANGQSAPVVHRHDGDRDEPYGIQALTVQGGRIGRTTSFNDPSLVPLFTPSEPRGSRGR